MPLHLSEEVTVALNKDVAAGSCTGVVIKSDEDTVQIALRDRGIVVKPGGLVHVRSNTNSKVAAWGEVDRFEYAGDVKLLTLGLFRYEGNGHIRASRCQVDVSLAAHFNGEDEAPKWTIGQAINLSLSGLLARFEARVPEGGTLHVIIHLSDEKVIDAIARVARVSGSADGSFEIGLEFQRFVRGYAHLIEAVPSSRDYPPARAA